MSRTTISLLSLLALTWLAVESAKIKLPVVLPPFNIDNGVKVDARKEEWGTCLLYMEGISITVFQPGASPTAYTGYITAIPQKDASGKFVETTHTFNWDNDYVVCPKNTTEKPKVADPKNPVPENFTLKVEIDAAKTDIKLKDKTQFSLQDQYYFKLSFQTVFNGGWKLVGVEATKPFTIKQGDWLKSDLKVDAGKVNSSIDLLEIGASSTLYNFGCSGTKLAVFPVSGNKDIMVGVAFNNFMFQPYNYEISNDGKKTVRFSRLTYDCVGTFTNGSFMGIIVALVLASITVFAFIMLNSVQTVDRFDDPKQKQLIINAKD